MPVEAWLPGMNAAVGRGRVVGMPARTPGAGFVRWRDVTAPRRKDAGDDKGVHVRRVFAHLDLCEESPCRRGESGVAESSDPQSRLARVPGSV